MIRIVIEIDEKTQEVHIEQPKIQNPEPKFPKGIVVIPKPKNHHTPIVSTKPKKCIICGIEFIPHANRQMKCRKDCSLEVITSEKKQITPEQIKASQGIPYDELRTSSN
jgi:hypothetical protein